MNFKNVNILPYLQARLGSKLVVQDGSDEVLLDCPECEEVGKLNCWWNIKKHKGVCYKCETPFNPVSMVRALEGCSLVDALKVLQQWSTEGAVSQGAFRNRVREAMAALRSDLPPPRPLSAIPLPAELVRASEASRWPKYLERVGSKKLVQDYGIGWCTYGYYKQRVIVPITLDGRVVTFVARAMWKPCKACDGEGCEACGNVRYKAYLYPRGSKTRQVLFNYDRARQYEHVVICEGVFDAIRVGPRGVAVLGSHLSDQQIALLLASRAREITLLFDPDTAGKAATTKSLEKLKAFYSRLRVVSLPHGRDPDQFRREKLWQIIEATPLLGSKGGLASRVRALMA